MSERFDWLELGKEAPPAPAPVEDRFDAPHYLQEAERLRRRGSYEAALKTYARALGEDPGLAKAWLGQVHCLAELGELDEARTWVNKAMERSPEDPELLAAKALVLARQGERQDAMAVCDRAMSKRDPPAGVWLDRGLVLLALGSAENAARCFTQALELAPKEGSTVLRVAIAYLDARNPGRAKGYLDRAMQEDPENPLAWYQAGRCFEGLYACGRALDCYEKALALEPEFKDRVIESCARIRRRGFFDRLKEWFHGA